MVGQVACRQSERIPCLVGTIWDDEIWPAMRIALSGITQMPLRLGTSKGRSNMETPKPERNLTARDVNAPNYWENSPASPATAGNAEASTCGSGRFETSDGKSASSEKPTPPRFRPLPSDLSKGVKHDANKIPLELLSSSWIEGVGMVLGFGAKKYAAHNWRKGLQLSRVLGAALRHIFSFLRGENADPESGLSHLYHASCCLMFASENSETHPELDDRYKVKHSQ